MAGHRHNMNSNAAEQMMKGGNSLSKFSEGMSPSLSPSGNDRQKAESQARRLNIPFIDPAHALIEPAAVSLLDPEAALRRQALPIRIVENTLLVAMQAPDQPVSIRSLELLTGFRICPAAAPAKALSAALEKFYGTTHISHSDFKNAGNNFSKIASSAETRTSAKTTTNISIISNKGGVGKTHLSINLAYAIAQTGEKVLLIDADLGNADISNKLGIFPQYHLMDFLEKKRRMAELICPTTFGFDLIGGSYGEFKLANLYHAQKIKFISHFKKISTEYDFVVFDLGAGISRTVLDFALAADHTLIVTTPQDVISGYACTKAAFSRFKEIETRLEEKGSDYEPQMIFSPMMVMNQVSNLRQGFELFETIKKTGDESINGAEGKFQIKPEYMGAIPYDKQSMRVTEGKRKPLLLTLPRTKASQSIQHMSKRFCDLASEYDPNIRSKHPLKRFAAILSQKT